MKITAQIISMIKNVSKKKLVPISGGVKKENLGKSNESKKILSLIEYS